MPDFAFLRCLEPSPTEISRRKTRNYDNHNLNVKQEFLIIVRKEKITALDFHET